MAVNSLAIIRREKGVAAVGRDLTPVAVLSVVKSVPNRLQITLSDASLETNVLRREDAMILFLRLRAEKPEELYHRNPVFEGARACGMQGEAPRTEDCILRAT